jgi:hypothetical protein
MTDGSGGNLHAVYNTLFITGLHVDHQVFRTAFLGTVDDKVILALGFAIIMGILSVGYTAT